MTKIPWNQRKNCFHEIFWQILVGAEFREIDLFSKESQNSVENTFALTIDNKNSVKSTLIDFMKYFGKMFENDNDK